ncbi:hypothetical protein RB195_018789 [Necator americanus]|uniref:Reverse transcriptase domain-containing protein n=1 Tax=Necator americanus TaxID=51031 RepID=A0ABR1CDF3_NECAM
MPFCLTFIDLKKAFDLRVETEALVEAFDNQGFSTQYIKKTRNTRLRAHLFNTTVLPALTYASETWAFRKQEENATRAVNDWVPRDVRRTTGGPPTRWSDFFTKSFKEKYDVLRVPRERRNHWATLARDRDKWENYWPPLDQFEDQRESR